MFNLLRPRPTVRPMLVGIWGLAGFVLASCGVPDASTSAVTSQTVTTLFPTIARPASPKATPFPSENELEATRAAIFQQERDLDATAAVMPPVTITEKDWPVPSDVATTPRPESVNYDCFDVAPQLFSASNCWDGGSRNNNLFLLAGRARDDETQGVILIPKKTPEGYTMDVIDTPTKEGKVTIEQVAFPLFFLKAENGVRFVFDFAARQWRDPATLPTPVATALTSVPLPSSTSEPIQSITMQTQVAQKAANETAITIYDATSAALPTPLPDDKTMVSSPLPTPTFVTGIQECNFVDQSRLLAVWTCWHDIRGNIYLTVLTGGELESTSNDTAASGGIKVCTLTITDRNSKCSDIYWLPVKAGKLTIVAVTWPHVTMKSATGKLYGFNAETLAWEEPQAIAPTPTWTPSPTSTLVPAAN